MGHTRFHFPSATFSEIVVNHNSKIDCLKWNKLISRGNEKNRAGIKYANLPIIYSRERKSTNLARRNACSVSAVKVSAH